MKFGFEGQRILNFDIEARPLGWYGGDWVHKETTAIAWAWQTGPEAGRTGFRELKRNKGSMRRMLYEFHKAYKRADIVVGHWIRGFDLPMLQWAMIDNNLPLLGPKLTHDTKEALVKFQGASKSQQNLASILGIASPKVAMTQQDWREANRLTRVGLALVRERCEADVQQNMEMHGVLQERGLLNPPRLWLPSTSIAGDYTP